MALPAVAPVLFKNDAQMEKYTNSSEQSSQSFDESSQSNSTDRLFKNVEL